MNKEFLAKKKDIAELEINKANVSDVTQIKSDISSMKNDIALNSTTLGVQHKNLLKVELSQSELPFPTGSSVSSGVIILDDCTLANNGEYRLGYGFRTQIGKKYTISLNNDCTIIGSVYLEATYDNSSSSISNGYDDTIPVNCSYTFTATQESTMMKLFSRARQTLNGLIKPMLRYADIIDDTYEPYKASLDERIAENEAYIATNKITLGCQNKNLLKNNAITKTISDVTFTVNDDKSVTANGTNNTSGYVSFVVFEGELGAGKYILSGGRSPRFRMRVNEVPIIGNVSCVSTDTGSGTEFTVAEKSLCTVTCEVESGVTADNIIYKPMIRYAGIADDTYEPYKGSIDERITNNASDIAVNKSDIAINKSAIAINKSALGYQRKNLLPYPKSIVKGGITFTCDENGYMTGSNTTSDTRQWTSTNAQYSMYLEAGTYYFSSFAETVCTNSDGRAYIIANGAQIVGVSTRETHVEKMFTLTESTTIYVMAKVYDGKVAFMIREVDITDDSYEPYKDSIDERLIKIQNEIGDIESVLSSVVEVS